MDRENGLKKRIEDYLNLWIEKLFLTMDRNIIKKQGSKFYLI